MFGVDDGWMVCGGDGDGMEDGIGLRGIAWEMNVMIGGGLRAMGYLKRRREVRRSVIWRLLCSYRMGHRISR